MSGSKRSKDKRRHRLTHIIGFIAVGLAIFVIIYLMYMGRCI